MGNFGVVLEVWEELGCIGVSDVEVCPLGRLVAFVVYLPISRDRIGTDHLEELVGRRHRVQVGRHRKAQNTPKTGLKKNVLSNLHHKTPLPPRPPFLNAPLQRPSFPDAPPGPPRARARSKIRNLREFYPDGLVKVRHCYRSVCRSWKCLANADFFLSHWATMAASGFLWNFTSRHVRIPSVVKEPRTRRAFMRRQKARIQGPARPCLHQWRIGGLLEMFGPTIMPRPAHAPKKPRWIVRGRTR